jgi:dGTPase
MSGFDTGGHSGKSLRTIIEFLPRDEIFAMDAKSLFAMAMGILALELKPQLRLFSRPDPFGRFVSFLVYLPRERLSTSLREQISKLLASAYQGTLANYYTQISESPLARVQIIINTTPGTTPRLDVAALEHTLSALVNVWQDALKDALREVGGFDHNGHTLRALTHVDSPYPRWRGLNLSWETLEGLAKHNGPVAQPGWALASVDAAFGLDLHSLPGLEAQVAAVADDIAYDNHDIDDGLRAGLLDFEALVALPMVARGWAEVLRRYPDVAPRRLRAELIRQQIGVMVNDVIDETRSRVAAAGVGSVAEVRAAGQALAGFSAAMADDERALKRFMYANLYHHPRQLEVADRARDLVTGLFSAYAHNPDRLPDEWRETLPDADPARSRHIGDFIAGMTDRYAIARYRQTVGPIDMPEGF